MSFRRNLFCRRAHSATVTACNERSSVTVEMTVNTLERELASCGDLSNRRHRRHSLQRKNSVVGSSGCQSPLKNSCGTGFIWLGRGQSAASGHLQKATEPQRYRRSVYRNLSPRRISRQHLLVGLMNRHATDGSLRVSST
jgi:hypothetical protein